MPSLRNLHDIIHTSFSRRVHPLCFMARSLPPSVKLMLYKQYVRPALEYAIRVWHCRMTAQQLSALDVLQAKVCRAFLRKKAVQFDTHETKENFNKLCFLESLHYRRQHISLVLLFKYVN
eukprot:scpid108492/ scgid19298/ 